MRLEGKSAVVTGASMGIGLEIARLFAAEGAHVVLSSRDAQRCEEARRTIGFVSQTRAVACDVRRREEIEQLRDAALQATGRIDIWVNNAGHGLMDSVAEMDMAACRSMFETNLFGAIESMQAVAPVMQRQGGGTIANISSIAGHIAVPYLAAYAATKHALNAISTAARLELRDHGIHVLTVCPGYIRTDFAVNAMKGGDVRRFSERVRRGITADRVAQAVLKGILKRKRMVVVPATDWLKVKLFQLIPGHIERAMMAALNKTDAESIAAARRNS